MTGRKIGLAIGINNYSDPKLPQLLFAKKDAEEVSAVLLDPDIGGFNEIVLLTDETKTNVKKAIEKLLLKDATFDDLVLIYFSGHGKQDYKFKLNLLLKDTEPDYLLSTALNFSFITECLEQSTCKKIVIILDCCHSGAAGTKGDISKMLSEDSGSGIFVLSATTGSNVAKEVQELENGIFTYFLLKGLRGGNADLGHDGLIDILELYEYASEECISKYSQVTTIKTDFKERIVIGKNPSQVKKNIFEDNKRELVKLRKSVPVKLYDEAMTVLIKDYKNPSDLTDIEIEILESLCLLLSGEIKIETYVHTVQCLKSGELVPILNEENLTFKSEEKQIITSYTTLPKQLTLDGKRIGITHFSSSPNTFISPSTDIEFVLLPAGKFMMGWPSHENSGYDYERPVHKVTIQNPFYVGKYPVTQKQWVAVMGNNPSQFKGDKRPVESVSWENIQEFIKKLNGNEGTDKYRLLSEAEWEYACRADTQTRYFFGDDESKLDEYAWYTSNSGSETHPVGKKKPNTWGFYDIYGNVWEWVQDEWHDNYEGAPSDGSAWEDGDGSRRVIRGGGWNDGPRGCRSARRSRIKPGNRYGSLGFRLLRKL